MFKKLIGEILGQISNKIFGTMNNAAGETYLSVEEEPHLSEKGGSPYYVVTTCSCSNGYQQGMKCTLPLMEYLLNGYTVLTHVYISRRQKEAIEHGIKFCADYAKAATEDSTRGERVYINGEGEMIAITKGINKNLAETIMNTPQLVHTVGYWQTAYEEAPEQNSITDFQSAWGIFEKDSIIDIRYPGVSRGVLVGISKTEGAEAQLVDKLLKFARLHETKIDFGWPEALAVAQATDASVLANRISFAQESVRKKQ